MYSEPQYYVYQILFLYINKIKVTITKKNPSRSIALVNALFRRLILYD